MARVATAWALSATLLLAGETVTPDAIRLARIRYHMSQNLTQIPNYTCTQTIERSTRRAKGRKFQLIDTLRLEVALVNGNEMFAWPGSGRFEDKKIADLVGRGGAIGNGAFAGHARAVFLSGAPRFSGRSRRIGLRNVYYQRGIDLRRAKRRRVMAFSRNGVSLFGTRTARSERIFFRLITEESVLSA